jgi:hypothetical protein
MFDAFERREQEKTLKLTPKHIERRVFRKVGKTFLRDFYYLWLYFLGFGLPPETSKNEELVKRILWLLKLYTKREHNSATPNM